MININQYLSELSGNKLKDYICTVDKLIAIQSSYYYAKAEDQLGYYTIAQNEENYRKKIAELLEEMVLLEEEKKKVTILELGGGTGKFCEYITNYLQNKNIQHDYTIVDISTSQYDKIKKKIQNLNVIEKSFTEFVKNNKKQYDILIMNETLDMWAGKHVLQKKWNDESLPYEIYWVVLNLENNKLVKKKDLQKIKNEAKTHYLWLKIYGSKTTGLLQQEVTEENREKIQQPEEFKILLSKIKLLAVIQDYWSFNDQENKLRMGLYEESVVKTIERINNLPEEVQKKVQHTWTEELEKTPERKAWIESDIIPFGLVDVTYSPNQGELFDLSLEQNLELVSYYAENVKKFDDSIYTVGGEENEVFILFTPYASELRFKRTMNF